MHVASVSYGLGIGKPPSVAAVVTASAPVAVDRGGYLGIDLFRQTSSWTAGYQLTYNVTTQNATNGTTLYWKVNHVTTTNAMFSATSGSFTVTSNAGSFTVQASGPVGLTSESYTFTVSVSLTNGGTALSTSASTKYWNKFVLSVGYNAGGQLGDNSTVARSTFTLTNTGSYISIYGSIYASAATKPDGTAWVWGVVTNGLSGLNDAFGTARSSPVQLSAGPWYGWSAGNYIAMALTNQGSYGNLFIWGQNTYGALGNGTATTAHKSSPVQIGSAIGSGQWITSGAGLGYNGSAIDTRYNLYRWGLNTTGQVGNNSTISQTTMVAVTPQRSWSVVSSGMSHAIGIDTAGNMYTWGSNTYGQLGLNIATTINRSSPSVIGAGWSYAVALGYSNIAIKTDGTVWTWGLSSNGEGGRNSTVTTSQIGQVMAGTTFNAIDAGYAHCLARSGSTLYGWGLNTSGQLADGTLTNKSSPIQIDASGQGFYAGMYQTHLLVFG